MHGVCLEMKSFRSKPTGWRYESQKHSLAAKGVKTRYRASVAESMWAIGGSEGGTSVREEEKRDALSAFMAPPEDFAKSSYGSPSFMAKKEVMRRRYNVTTKQTADFLKGMFDDGRPKVADFAENRKQEDVVMANQRVMEKIRLAEDNNEITSDNANRFLRDDFTTASKDYLDNPHMDRSHYDGEVDRLLERHMSRHGKSAKMFG